MSDIRKKGLKYLKDVVGYEEPELVAVSKFYEAKESWTKKPTWWFDMPIKQVNANLDKNYYLIGENKERGFVVLRVPNRFLYDNIGNFDTTHDDVIRLHLAAYQENWLFDERTVKKRVNFCSFELK